MLVKIVSIRINIDGDECGVSTLGTTAVVRDLSLTIVGEEGDPLSSRIILFYRLLPII